MGLDGAARSAIKPTHSAGYWPVGADGGVFAPGDASYLGSGPGLPPAERPAAPAVGAAE